MVCPTRSWWRATARRHDPRDRGMLAALDSPALPGVQDEKPAKQVPALAKAGVIPHAFGERAILKLMYAALIRAAERWRGIRITEFEQRQLRAIAEEIDKDFAALNAPAATAPQSHLSSNHRT